MEKPEKMGSFFDRRAEIYERYMRENVEGICEIYRLCARQFACRKGLNLLDLGCGTGSELEEIFARTPDIKVTGIDLSANMLEILRKKFRDKTAQLNLVCGSFADMDLGGGQYDYAVSVMAMHHYTHAQKGSIYQKVYKALKPGGTYIEADYTVPAPEMEKQFLAEYERLKKENGMDDAVYHIDIPFTSGTQQDLLRGAGFSDVSPVLSMHYATMIAGHKF